MEFNREQGGSGGLTVGVDDLKGLFQSRQIYDTIYDYSIFFGLAQCSQLVMASSLTKAQNEGHVHMLKA